MRPPRLGHSLPPPCLVPCPGAPGLGLCPHPRPTCYSTPSMKLVSRCWMRTRKNDISLRVFSKMTRGSSDLQRRQLGAITMARLLTSILVMATLAGCTNTCAGQQLVGWGGAWGVPGVRGPAEGGGWGVPWAGPTAHLEKADEVAQHQAVDAGQRVHHGHGGLGALVVRDALLVELVRDQGLLQLPVPQLQQRRCGHSAAAQAGLRGWQPPDPRPGNERGCVGAGPDRKETTWPRCAAGPGPTEFMDLGGTPG